MGLLALDNFLELQAELHRRVEEAVDRLERHRELFRNSAERQADLELVVADFQIPELVLEDDGHLLRILPEQPLGNAHAIGLGGEGDVEMVLARQALFDGVDEHAAHYAAQRLLGQEIVADLVGHADIRGFARILTRLAPKAIPAGAQKPHCHN